MPPTTAELELRNAPTTLPTAQLDDIDRAARLYVQAAERPNTGRAYDGDYEVWQKYCDQQGLPYAVASEGILVMFAEWMCQQRTPPTAAYPEGNFYAATTLRRRLAGVVVRLRAELGVGQVPKGISEPAAKIINAYAHRLAEARIETGRGKAPALWAGQVEQLCSHLDLGTAIGKRDLALFLLWIYSGSRRSEMARLEVGDIIESDEGLELIMPATKTGQRAPIAPHDHPPGPCQPLCPVGAWNAWRAFAALVEGSAFRRVDRHGNIHALGISGAAASERLKVCCQRAGLPAGYKGHSMRRGHISIARSQGKDAKAISANTGHAPGSKALQEYIDLVDKWTDNSAHGLLSPLHHHR